MKSLRVLFFVLPAIPCLAQSVVTGNLVHTRLPAANPANWTGQYAPCDDHAELLSHTHLDLAVRISTANATLAEQFENALDFWSGVLDLDWHEVGPAEECSMQLVDGTPSLFNWCVCMSARAQLPDRDGFQGWIAFNPRYKLSRDGMFFDSVHEIGHVLGLAHSDDESSIMFAFGEEDGPAWLDEKDLDALSLRHALRPGIRGPRGGIKVMVRLPSRLAEHTRRGFWSGVAEDREK